jgi:DinB family protein
MDFLAEAMAKLLDTPVRVAELAHGLSEEQLSWKPTEFFSLRESILHLRDIDVEGYERRVRMTLEQETPTLPDVDGGKLARERNYNAQPVDPAMTELAIVRAAAVERLSQCTDADLERTAEMQGQGVIMLRQLLEMWMRHDAEHLADMAELRRALDAKDGNPSFGEHEAA